MRQAERKATPSTRRLDLDNTNVRTHKNHNGKFPNGAYLIFLEIKMVKINGVSSEQDGRTLSEYLQTTNYNLRFIAVERNGEIVPKAQYDTTVLQDGDTIEIVSFVGGG